MENIKKFTVFVASPSDVVEERAEVCKVVEEINRQDGRLNQFVVQEIKWEDATSKMGSDGQSVLNEQLRPEDQDLFVAIFWSKIGSPTPRDKSGTLEELNAALESYSQRGRPTVKVYFSQKSYPQSVKPEDIKAIQDLKKDLQTKGLYEEFDGLSDLHARLSGGIKKYINDQQEKEVQQQASLTVRHESRLKYLSDRLSETLSAYGDINVTWIDRLICSYEDLQAKSFDKCIGKSRPVKDILDLQVPCIIRGQSQFGLTSLAHWLALKALEDKGEHWLYVDSLEYKGRSDRIGRIVTNDLLDSTNDVQCVVVDNWTISSPIARKVIENLRMEFPSARLIIMQTENDIQDSKAAECLNLGDDAKCYELMPLPRDGMRQIVGFCSARMQGDIDAILSKLDSDLRTLNIHRTPINCMTILEAQRASDGGKVINRSHLLDMVLASIFMNYTIPVYDKEPDVKDCEFVLGAFCESLIRENTLVFKEENFRAFAAKFLNEQGLPLEITPLWNILETNKIIIRDQTGMYKFRFAFWIHFFAAKRMTYSPEFKSYIMSERHYVSYPEMIEFYTGVTRSATDVLDRIGADIEYDISFIEQKIGFSDFKNPLDYISWKRSEEGFENARKRLRDAVDASTLPTDIKDRHSDADYDFKTPYSQDIRQFLDSLSFQRFVYMIKTFSRALRNSDYVSIEKRQSALALIIKSWTIVSKVLFALSPILARDKRASFLDFRVALGDGFEDIIDDPEKIFKALIMSNPENAIHRLIGDLSSERLGNLCDRYLNDKIDSLSLHLMVMYLAATRPHGWESTVKRVINGCDQDSFILLSLLQYMQYLYKYDSMSIQDSERMKTLMEHVLAKHELNNDDYDHGYQYRQHANKYIPNKHC